MTRYLKEMQSVVFDQDFARQNPRLELYSVRRGIKKEGELRYDETVIPAQMLGKEYVRTKGNLNSAGYSELYTVLEGEALFLLQKSREQVIEDVFAVRAQKGEWLIVSPGYAIISINPTKQTLKLGNWVCKKTKNLYEELEKMGGACYFYTDAGWIKNKNYKKIPPTSF